MNKYLDAPQAIYKLTDKNSRWLEANEQFAKLYDEMVTVAIQKKQ